MSLTTFSAERIGARVGRDADLPSKVTVPSLLEKKLLRRPITAVTAYDYASARLVDEAGLDVVLVGDSLAMVMQGHENTLAVTMDEMLLYTRGVRRAVRRALLVADMPFGSYQTDEREGVANAVRFVKEAGAEAVKLEGGRERKDLVRRMVDAEIPVMGHLGLTPQSVHRMGGYKVQGKTMEAIDELRTDALALEDAGCFALVLEGVPRELARNRDRGAADSNDRNWRGTGLRWADSGAARHDDDDVFGSGQVCAALRGCGGSDARGVGRVPAAMSRQERFRRTRRATIFRGRCGS